MSSLHMLFIFSGFFGADCKNLGLGQATPPSTSSGTPETGTKEHQDGTKGPLIFANLKERCQIL